MAAPVNVWFTCIAWNCSPKVLKPMTLLAAKSARLILQLLFLQFESAQDAIAADDELRRTNLHVDLVEQRLDAPQQIRALGDGQHDPFVDRAEERQAFVLVHFLNGARVVASADLHDDGIRGDQRRQLVDIQPTSRAYSRPAGSALISGTMRVAGSASVTTILVSELTKWSTVNSLNGKRVRTSMRTAASVSKRPLSKT